MNAELISVIIPVYNSEKHLKRCLDSIINQTYRNLEIICIDDCSTDSSLKLVNEYSLKDSRFKIISNKKNKGQATSRNKAIKIAKGSLISFVDSDDAIDLSMLEKLITKYKETNACITLCNYIRPNSKTKATQYTAKYSKDELFKYTISRKLSSSACNKLYKRDFIIENNLFFEEGRIYEDALLAYKVIYYANKISVLNEPLYFYYDNEGTTSRSLTEKFFNDIEYAIIECKKFLKENVLYEEYKFYQEERAINFCNYILYKISLLNTTDETKFYHLDKLWNLVFKHVAINDKNKVLMKVMLYNSYKNLNSSDKLIKEFSTKFKNHEFLFDVIEVVNTDIGLSQSIIDKLTNRKIKKNYLYGAGEIAEKLISALEQENIQILGILDSNSQSKKELQGYPIYSSKDFNYQNTQEYFVVASESSAYEITLFLESKIEKEKIINFYDN